MPIIRKFAIQGHAVPSSVQTPRGPFPPEVLAQPQMTEDIEHGDSLHVGLDDVRFFRCKECEEILESHELNEHNCEDFK